MNAQLQEQARVIGEQIGERVGYRDVDWNALLQAGVVVDLSIGRWRAVAQISLDDLGIEPETDEQRRAFERSMTLGQRHLLPKDTMREIARVEKAGRDAQWAFSLKTHWGRFIPAKNYRAWRQQNDTLRAAYMGLADKILDNWEALTREVRTDFATVGADNWRRLRAEGAPVTSDQAEYVQAFVTRCLLKLESPEYVRSTYTWEHSATLVPLTPGVTDAFRPSGDPMLDDIARTNRREAGSVQRFAADVQAAIRALVYETCVAALDTMRGNGGKLHRNSTTALKGLIEEVERLQFWPDASLDTKLAELRALCETKSTERSNDDVSRVLRELSAESRLLMLELDRPPARSAADLGIPDTIDELLDVTGARTVQDVDVLDEPGGSDALDILAADFVPSGRYTEDGRPRNGLFGVIDI